MQLRNPFLILSILSAAIVLYVACNNFSAVAVAGFGAPAQIPVGALMLVSYLLGLLGVGGFWATKKQRAIRGEQAKLGWEKEDLKLTMQIESDKIKLLEAKIATLEVALNKALKKKDATGAK
jgi:hypothetical protein